MKIILPTVFNVVLRLYEYSHRDGLHIQTQKIHYLLYLTQGYYTLCSSSPKMLMPAVFVMNAQGPLEPNVYWSLESGVLNTQINKMPDDIEKFLSQIWTRFGHHSSDHLGNFVKKINQPLAIEEENLISFDQIKKAFQRLGDKKDMMAKRVSSEIKKSSKGGLVRVSPWVVPHVR